MIEVLGGDGSAVAGRHQHRNFICGRFYLTPASEDVVSTTSNVLGAPKS